MPDRKRSSRFIPYFVIPVILLLSLLAVIIFLVFTSVPGPVPIILALGFTLVVTFLLYRSYRNELLKVNAERELKDSRDKYQAMVETSTEGTVLILDGNMIYANLIFLAITGYTFRQFKDLEFKDVFILPGGTGSDLDQLINQLESSGTSISLEAEVRHKQGELRDVIMTISRLEYLDKQGIIIVVKDVTRKDRIRKETDQLSDELQTSILLMNLPVSSLLREHASCLMDQSIREAAELMHRKKQDAILVIKDERNYVGIITDADLRNRVVSRNYDTGKPVFEIMSSPLQTIPHDSLLFEAMLMVKEKSISHLAVSNEHGDVTGIFSREDLFEVQRNTISYQVKEIQDAESVDALKRIYEKVPGLVKTILDSGAKIQNITHMISSISDAISERLIEFAIEEMGEPPARFAFVALGSEGRREQTMVTDQDNAIIIEDVSNEKLATVNRYFLYFGKKINDWLNKVGYDYCDGEIMAGNPQWCQPLSRWKKYFTDWITQSSSESLLGVSIFFDFRLVYGEKSFGKELRKHIYKTSRKEKDFFRHLVQNTQIYKPPLNLLRSQQPDTRAGQQDFIDIKIAVRPFIEFVRIYAIWNELSESNTIQRLERLLLRGNIRKNDFDEIFHAYNTLMEIRFRSQLDEILNNKLPDNYIKPQELKEFEKTLLSKILSEVSTYQSRLALEFKE